MTALVLMLLAFFLGFSLQTVGVDFSSSLSRALNIPDALTPVFIPMILFLSLMMIVYVNRREIAANWSATHIQKPDLRMAVAILFAPGLALIINVFIGLNHFGLSSKEGLIAGMAIVQFSFFTIMGNYATALRVHSPGGFRTPWTLKSDRVWIKTHRFIAYGLTIAGALGIIFLPFFAPKMLLMAHLATVISVKLIAFGLSWYFWQSELRQLADE